MRLLIVVDEFRDRFVVSTADHAVGRGLTLNYTPTISICLDLLKLELVGSMLNVHFFSYSGLSFVFGE